MENVLEYRRNKKENETFHKCEHSWKTYLHEGFLKIGKQ